MLNKGLLLDTSSINGGFLATTFDTDALLGGRETVTLSKGNDFYALESAHDITVRAGQGDDTVVREGVGNDVIDGGDGIDTLVNDVGGTVVLNSGRGSDFMISWAGDAILKAGDGDGDTNTMIAGGGNVTMYGNAHGVDWYIFAGGQGAFNDSVRGAMLNDHFDFSNLGNYDGNGQYHETTLDQLSLHGSNQIWIEENGHTDVINIPGIAHMVAELGGFQAAEDAGLFILSQKGAEFHPDHDFIM